VAVQAVIGLGIKVVWTDEDLDRARAAAQRRPGWFASGDEAAARYLRVSGLADLLAAGDPAIDAGLREQDGRWRLAMDPGAFTVGARYGAPAGTVAAGHLARYRPGDNPGYRSLACWIPDRAASIVILVNDEAASITDLLRQLLPAALKP
jgi:hypothetical protein